ncbi:protein of unknown function [Candidatus Nitrotoga arctica]|uniref:Uncharacterized protein n=1 Tax=Candidatus Nitrotoga arctica TaxID=453162 RepID=A0ABN8AJM3_9PROT|nr:protein of unknown function [Candidatus Nitrotoga arctica]
MSGTSVGVPFFSAPAHVKASMLIFMDTVEAYFANRHSCLIGPKHISVATFLKNMRYIGKSKGLDALTINVPIA